VVNLKEEAGIRRTVWLPKDLDTKVEEARKKLGLRRSAFYRYAIVKLIEGLVASQNAS